MFTTTHNECVGFESRWKVKKTRTVNSTQTDDTSANLVDVESQLPEQKHIEVQCEAVEKPNPGIKTTDEQLANWLKFIYPLVDKQLNKQYSCFKNYKLLSDTLLTECVRKQDVHLPNSCPVSGLYWNRSGKLLGVTIRKEHANWCHHEGFALIFSLHRNGLLTETPKLKITTSSCLTALAFHPDRNFVVAGGTHAGKLLIWNIEDEVELLVQVEAHLQQITQISWIPDFDVKQITLLVTSGLDGPMTIWDTNLTNNATLTARNTYVIKSKLFSNCDNKVNRAITAFDFSSFVRGMFVVGAEGGLVALGSILGATKLPNASTNMDVYDPITKYYKRQTAEILNCRFSFHNPAMFATIATDGEIRLYLTDDDIYEPIRIICVEPFVNMFEWMRNSPNRICVCNQVGAIEMLDIVKGVSVCKSTLDKEQPADGVSTEQILSLALNPLAPEILISGNNKGQLHLWNIPWSMNDEA